MSRPRMSRRPDSGRSSTDVCPRWTVPETWADRGSSRVSAIAVTLLPQPDSPTRASTSPGATVKLTVSTARTGPSSVRNETVNSRTDSSGSLIGGSPADRSSGGLPGVEGVAQAVAEQVQPQREQHDAHPGQHAEPRPAPEQRRGAGP